MKQLFFTAILAFAATGCEQARSFMHMDSNSGSPFLGLQLSVDADTPNGNEVTIAELEDAAEQVNEPKSVFREVSASGRATDFVPTARRRTDSGNLKYSLPSLDLSKNPDTAAEVEDILTRL